MRVLHVFRAPVGGLFRHVRDLSRGLALQGHDVGLVCDSSSGGDAATKLLESVRSYLHLGIERLPISRLPGIGDLGAALAIARHARKLKPDVIHCHGAKGGLHGRIAARMLSLPSVYAPHGGSLHYDWKSPVGAAFLASERILGRIGSGLHFVCEYERRNYDAKIGIKRKPNAVIYNGLWSEEFVDIPLRDDAADTLFLGDMRWLKGVDVFLDALVICNRVRRVTAVMVGDGPQFSQFREYAEKSDVGDVVGFPGRMDAAAALSSGRIVVVPSRAESFPYVLLEASAVGRPIIASSVGGIPEVAGSESLVPAGDAEALAERILHFLAEPSAALAKASIRRQELARCSTVEVMVDRVVDLYHKSSLATM